MTARIVLGMLVSAVVIGGLGPSAAAAERTHAIVLEDYFTLTAVTDCALSPDGAWVAYTEMRWDEEADKRNTDLWVVNVASQEVTRLTFDLEADTDPA